MIDGGDDEQDDEQVDEQEASQLRRSHRVRALDNDFKSDTEEEDAINQEDIEFESDHEEVVETRAYEQEDE